ncbi:tetratricopeptide repeat protein [Massilia sp. P8910]|uniref:tetratricopeptide repeat protein n=1 Tax=Massilia antarctica TaxID=2765360 RepID=UPI001E5B0EE1|nr:tetratricopeptide repeat protein [Massilia antarctica]MCE3602774.1 tetratricopeptide repeat protein [Massilia antarctica]
MTVSRNISDISAADELLALARLDVEKNQLDSALEKLKSILGGPEPDPEAMSMAARVYAQLGLFTRAQGLFRRFLVAHPGAVNEQFQLAMTHMNNSEPAEAEGFFNAILASTPTHPPALFYSALLLSQQGKTLDAKRSLDILLQSAPADNLYAGRGKQLRDAIDAGLQASFEEEQREGGALGQPKTPGDTYQ